MPTNLKKKLEMIISLKGAKKFLSSIKKISEGIFFIGEAAKKMVQLFKATFGDAIRAASQLQEAVGKFSVVFRGVETRAKE